MVKMFWLFLAGPGEQVVIWIHFFWAQWKGKVIKWWVITVTSSTGTTHLISTKINEIIMLLVVIVHSRCRDARNLLFISEALKCLLSP